MKSGAELITDERMRQQMELGYTAEHDDRHANGEILYAAQAFLMVNRGTSPKMVCAAYWPFEPESFKPGSPIESLVKAGAMIAAEIDRLQRIA